MAEFLKKLPKQKLLKSNKGDLIKNLPETSGVYIFYKKETPIYIGKAINLKRRVNSYFDLDLEPKTRKMIAQADYLSFVQVSSELEALLLEAKLIRKYMPQYNIAAKDDKHPLYILVTKENYPRIITARKNDLPKYKVKGIYGPFPSSTNVKQVLKWLRRVFPYSDHKLAKSPCLYSHIGLCVPCPSYIDQLTDTTIQKGLQKQYLLNVRRLKAILDGKIDGVKAELTREMDSFSQDEKYEDALNLRKQIERLEYITRPQMPVDYFLENPNLYEDLRAKELSDLKLTLSKYDLLITKLNRIECFDIAHLAGASPTASMVTFTEAEPDKTFYRHFKITQKKSGSDVDSLKEVIKRRLNHLKDWGKPDLIIVDGGKPQVSVFVRELEKEGIPVIGIAKRFETLVFPKTAGHILTFKEYRLPTGPTLSLIQRLRDEAHRFARRYHHKLLSNRLSNENPY